MLRRAAGELADRCPPLICTQGWPSTAFHRLARAVVSGGGRLLYHGDFDWPGIEMTSRLLQRYPCSPWRMTAQDYLAGLTDKGTPVPLKNSPLATPWDPELARAMAARGAAVYEEALADALIADLAAAHHSPGDEPQR